MENTGNSPDAAKKKEKTKEDGVEEGVETSHLLRRNSSSCQLKVAKTSTPTPQSAAEPANVVEPPKAPADPVAAKPAEPVAAKPADPAATKPVDPVAAKPADPVATKPADPVAAKPVEPVATKSTDPVATKPADPVLAKPAPVMPPSEPTVEPTEAEKSVLAAVQPTQYQKPDQKPEQKPAPTKPDPVPPTPELNVEATEAEKSVLAQVEPTQYMKPKVVNIEPLAVALLKTPKQATPVKAKTFLTLPEQAFAESMLAPPKRRIQIEFDYDHGQHLGVVFSSRLGVLDVDQRPGISPVWDKLKPSDILRKVGDVKVSNMDDLNRCLVTQQSPITFHVDRFLTIHVLTPARMEYNNVDMTNSNDMLLTVYLLHRKNAKLGFAVKAMGEMVVVVRVDDSGIAYATLEPGDIILDINGTKIADTEQAKQVLQAALKKHAIASLAIKRPMTAETLVKVATVIKDDPGEPDMHIDAVLIGRMEACRRHLNLRRRAEKKCLVKRSRKTSRQSFHPDLSNTEEIHSEVDAKDWDALHVLPHRTSMGEPKEPRSTKPNANTSTNTTTTTNTSSNTNNNANAKTLKNRMKLLITKLRHS